MNKIEKTLRKNPPTVVLTSRCDARSLAALASFWISQGETPRSQSELVRLSLEFLTEIITKNFNITTFQNTSSAREYLQLHGILTQGRRNFKTLAKQVEKESFSLEDFKLNSVQVDKMRSKLEDNLQNKVEEREIDLEEQQTLLKTKPERGN